MHYMMSMTKCARLQGTGGKDRDFTEAVAIMFENFLWTPRHMADCSLHYSYQSPEYEEAWLRENLSKERPQRQLPLDLIERLVKARNPGLATNELRKIAQSKYDFMVHGQTSRQELEALDLSVLFNKMHTQTSGIQNLEVETGRWDWGHGFASLRQITQGYDAYVYAYVFSQIWAYDLFENGFKADTMSAEKGKRYRDVVLFPGGSQPPMEILKQFLGREPNDGAFCRALGVESLE